MQGTEKICVAKPVASKPLSKVIFYPQFMAEAKISQTSAPSEKTIAIKPKTVRLRSWPSSAPETVPPKCLQNSGIASSEKGSATNLAADFRSSILYKPTAKVASATKAPPLENLETFDAYFHENMHSQAPIYEPNLSNQHTTNQHQNSYSYADVSQICEPSNATSQDMELDMKIQHHSGDKLSYDGYNWRKYGQKQVKGSEYPRSYYKCTHPNCPVKKNVERSLAGQIAEIVYKGEHNHPKLPQSLKRLSSNSQGQADVSDEQGRGDDLLQTISSGWNTSAGVMNNNCNEVGVHLAANCARRTNDQSCKGGSRVVNVTGDKFNHKRRDDNQVCLANTARTDGAGCNHTTQHCTDTEISGDGFQWRKYGQKVVKGNSHPRGYYRCTTPRCNVRKYVERATDESGSLVTRYEGMHNHDMPTKR